MSYSELRQKIENQLDQSSPDRLSLVSDFLDSVETKGELSCVMNNEQNREQFESLIERVIELETEDFFEVCKVLDLNPLTDFAGADLHEVDLSGKNLQGANFKASNLSSANLRDTDLSFADLSYTDLSGADLHGANLTRANLRNTAVENAKFGNNQGIYERLKLDLIEKGAIFESQSYIKNSTTIFSDTVIVMEDFPEIQEVIRKVFEDDLKWKVKLVNNGDEALEKLKESIFFILDVNLGSRREQEGLETLERIKAQDPEAFVSILSAHPIYERRATKLGTDLFREKSDIDQDIHYIAFKMLKHKIKLLEKQYKLDEPDYQEVDNPSKTLYGSL